MRGAAPRRQRHRGYIDIVAQDFLDCTRTLDEIASLVAKRYGLQRSEARGAVERIFLEIFEASEHRSDSVSELE